MATLGVTCSIGVGTSKSVAKIASDRDKPRGLTVVFPGTEAAFLEKLPVRTLSGVGAAAERTLLSHGCLLYTSLIAEVVVANGDLASIRVLRCDDTIGIGTTAAPMMAARILEAKNLDVDVISGATTTSIAVRNAVSDAIMNAGGDPATFSLGAAEPSGGTDQAVEVDVALAGAGTAGLIAAVRLLEAGKSVVLFEKQDIAGGSMPMTYSGVAAAESELQANYAVGPVSYTHLSTP